MSDPFRRGIRVNRGQFTLLVGINALVGVLVGQERSLLPLLAEQEFGIASGLAASAFLVTFGLAKAPSNLVAGMLIERYGARRVLIAGWLTGAPVPLLLMAGPSWNWIIAANLLLGVNQGLTWSTTLLMKIRLAGESQRGRAVGFNEFAGYTAIGVSALVSGLLADRLGVRPAPFLLGLVVVVLGIALSSSVLRDVPAGTDDFARSDRGPLWTKRPLLTAARTALVNNANDAFAWALLPVLLLQEGLGTAEVAVVAATYPIVWGLLQLVTGPLSDRTGRRAPIVAGMLLQAGALGVFSVTQALTPALLAAATLGLGTALAYPALIAAAADAVPGARQPSAVGFFRMWRDGGYVAGALVFGGIADLWGLPAAAAAAALATGIAALDARANITHKHSSEPLNTPTIAA